MKKFIVDHFYSGNNFLGYLVQDENGFFEFGYDADVKEPRYMVHKFKKIELFWEFLNRNYGKNWR